MTGNIAADLHRGEPTAKSSLHVAPRTLRLTPQRQPIRCALDAPSLPRPVTVCCRFYRGAHSRGATQITAVQDLITLGASGIQER
jgi:hypothetical protein